MEDGIVEDDVEGSSGINKAKAKADDIFPQGNLPTLQRDNYVYTHIR